MANRLRVDQNIFARIKQTRGNGCLHSYNLSYAVTRKSTRLLLTGINANRIFPDITCFSGDTNSEPRQHQDRADRVSNLKKLEQETESGPSQKSQKQEETFITRAVLPGASSPVPGYKQYKQYPTKL